MYRTYTVLEKNGSIFIKLGQHLSALGYLLPPEWTVCTTLALVLNYLQVLTIRLTIDYIYPLAR